MTDDGGPAFCTRQFGQPDPHPGMSLRDWFAGMAMQALIVATATDPELKRASEEARLQPPECFAIAAYKTADAMIAKKRSTEE